MEGNNTNDQILTYDLRQRRAKLIADCIEDVVESCKAESYYSWLKNIDDLFSVSNHTFQEKKKAKEAYDTIRNEIVTLANANTSVWFGTSRDAKIRSTIDSKLRELFELVLQELETAGVFGTKTDEEGL